MPRLAARGARGRARAGRRRVNQRQQARRQLQSWGINGNVVPRVLIGAVDGIGLVAVGALDLVRNVLVSAVSGAANIGVEAVGATVSGTRGVVTAASQAVSDVAKAAQGTVQATVDNARHAGRGDARIARRRTLPSMTSEADESLRLVRPTNADAVRRRPRRGRGVGRPAQPGVAA